MRHLIVAAALFACLAPSAFAQTAGQPNSSQTDAASSQNEQTGNTQNNSSAQDATAVQQIKQDLQGAGFTDVKVVARSFVVQAKSKNGDPVLMTIGPHGMSVFEAMGSAGSGAGTVGSAGSNGSTSSGSGTSASSTQNQGTQK